MVMMGTLFSGRKMRNKSVQSPAPSTRAASRMAWGVSWKKRISRIMLYTLTHP